MELDSFCHPMPMKTIVLGLKTKEHSPQSTLIGLTHWLMAPGADAYLIDVFWS